MNTLAAIALLCAAELIAIAQTTTNKVAVVSWKLQPPVSGLYEPAPNKSALGGEKLRIEGTNFQITWWSDAVGTRIPVYKGSVKNLGDHIYLDHPKVPNPERISGLLGNWPVVWTWDGYDEWKKTGRIGEGKILYMQQQYPRVEPNGAANRSQPVRAETNRTPAAAGSGR